MSNLTLDGVNKSHRNPVRFVGTTQKGWPTFFDSHDTRVCVWESICLVVVIINLVLYPSQGETREFPADLAQQYVSPELAALNSHRVFLVSERASSAMVKTIMTLLATLDEAEVLPSEGTAQANQVIHGVIQLQSALMKSPSPELAAYWMAAEAHWTSQRNDRQDGVLRREGLTTEVLAALILWDEEHPMWKDQKVVSAMQAFNVTHEDWLFMVNLFHQANMVFREQGRSIHKVYDTWRVNLSGGES